MTHARTLQVPNLIAASAPTCPAPFALPFMRARCLPYICAGPPTDYRRGAIATMPPSTQIGGNSQATAPL